MNISDRVYGNAHCVKVGLVICTYSSVPYIHLQLESAINDYIKNNPIRNPESVEVGPYGDMPGTRSLNDPLLLMLLPLVIFGPAEGFLEEGVAAPACVGRPESPTTSPPVATPPPVQAPIPLRPAA